MSKVTITTDGNEAVVQFLETAIFHVNEMYRCHEYPSKIGDKDTN